MPEIAEIYRIVHFLRRHLVNRKIATVHAQDDPIVYGKVGCSAAEFQSSLVNKTVVDVKQQGKYFWLVMSSPPHPLMHFGMTGWIKFSNDDTAHYRTKSDVEEWPPRFWKFRLVMEGEPECEVAFVDARRLGRIRLVDVPADKMRKSAPLSENGPDPVVDKDIFTKEWFRKKMKSKRVPVKALLLDQHNISGVGNWVADEVLYQARTHPEQYSNTFSDEQTDRIHDKIVEVCTVACDLLAESDRFPEDWLMKHRWNKGKKNANVLPNGEKIVHIKVGGRTSAVVPSIQKKTGDVAGDITAETIIDDGDDDEGKGKTSKPKKSTAKLLQNPGDSASPLAKRGKKGKPVKEEDDEEEQPKPKLQQKRKAANPAEIPTIKKSKSQKFEPASGMRRSSRRST